MCSTSKIFHDQGSASLFHIVYVASHMWQVLTLRPEKKKVFIVSILKYLWSAHISAPKLDLQKSPARHPSCQLLYVPPERQMLRKKSILVLIFCLSLCAMRCTKGILSPLRCCIDARQEAPLLIICPLEAFYLGKPPLPLLVSLSEKLDCSAAFP